MSKIDTNYYNPIDQKLIDISDKLSPTFKNLNFTPNGITTLSLIFGVLSIYVLYKPSNNTYIPYLFTILYLISYFFDVMDGHYARKYNMTSNIGDIYDHVKDLLVNIVLVYVLIIKYNLLNHKYIILILIIFGILQYIRLGCIDKTYDKKSGISFYIGRKICYIDDKDKLMKIIHNTKLFDTVSFILLLCITVLYLFYKKK